MNSELSTSGIGLFGLVLRASLFYFSVVIGATMTGVGSNFVGLSVLANSTGCPPTGLCDRSGYLPVLGIQMQAGGWECQPVCDSVIDTSDSSVNCSSYQLVSTLGPCHPVGIRFGYENHIQHYGTSHWTYIATGTKVSFPPGVGNPAYSIEVGTRYRVSAVNNVNYTGQRFFRIGDAVYYRNGDVGNMRFHGAEMHLAKNDSQSTSGGPSSAYCATYGAVPPGGNPFCAARREWSWRVSWTDGNSGDHVCGTGFVVYFRKAEANVGAPIVGGNFNPQLTGLHVTAPWSQRTAARGSTEYDRAWLTILDTGFFVYRAPSGPSDAPSGHISGIRRSASKDNALKTGFDCRSVLCEGESADQPSAAKLFGDDNGCSVDLCYGAVEGTPCCRNCETHSVSHIAQYLSRSLPILWRLEFIGSVRYQNSWETVVRDGIGDYNDMLRDLNDESVRSHGDLLREAAPTDQPDIVVRIFEDELVMFDNLPLDQKSNARDPFNHLHFVYRVNKMKLAKCNVLSYGCCRPMLRRADSTVLVLAAASKMRPKLRWDFGSYPKTDIRNLEVYGLPARRMFLHEFGHTLGLKEFNYVQGSACQFQNADAEIMCQWSTFALCPNKDAELCRASDVTWDKVAIDSLGEDANLIMLRAALCNLHRGVRLDP